MVGVFCRGVCVRENLVIRIMCHQANGLLCWMRLTRQLGSSALDPHGGFIASKTAPAGIQSLDREHITLQMPGWTVLLSHNDVEMFHMEASICYKHVQITYKPSGETCQQHE